MKQLTKCTLLAITLFGLASCGGDTKVNPTVLPDIPLKVRSAETNFPTNILYYSNYRTPNLEENLVLHESRRSGKQFATEFSYARNLWVHRLTWLGGVKNNASLLDGNAQFILRVYSYDLSQSEHEYLVEAKAELIGNKSGAFLYEFSYADAELFNVPAGNYLLAIVDPEVEGIGFSWAQFAEEEPSSTRGFTASRMSEKGNWTFKDATKYFYGPLFLKVEGGKN